MFCRGDKERISASGSFANFSWTETTFCSFATKIIKNLQNCLWDLNPGVGIGYCSN